MLKVNNHLIVLLVIIAFMLGALLGVIAGLLPGIHPNNTIPLILAFASFFEPLNAAIILVTAGVINSFIAFIPSIFLGAPDEDEVLSVLPGHRMLLEGRGLEAVQLTAFGGLGAIALGILLLPLLTVVIPPIYSYIRPNTHWLLAGAVIYLLFCESNIRKMGAAMVIFGLTGLLGFVVLDIFVIDQGLLPLLSGLFGVPTLIIALKERPMLHETILDSAPKEKLSEIMPGILTGALAGILAGMLPGIGSSQAAMLVQSKNTDEDANTRHFLVTLGGISAADMLYSLFALWLIGNPRSGIAVAVGQLIKIGVNEIILFSTVVLLAAVIGIWLTLRLARHTLRWLRHVNYQKLCGWVLIGILSLVALLSGPTGLIVLCTATGIGLLAQKLSVRRSWAMGCLIVPTILYFARI
ncbi:MAG: tripartite tricarboxylate transporter permease [Candidatus Aenigmatarchaeota archaeon]